MSYAIRAVISVLTGMGAGAVGLWVVWRLLMGTEPDQSVAGLTYNSWVVVGIFAPGIVVALVTFWATSYWAENSKSQATA
ncbi:MAG TPA: hypothetical protein VGZ47_18580 [Gemmataceae bacterium]|jgi:hypothetical protein|nr:hypothetical protein [Gemmataceae bacterium]